MGRSGSKGRVQGVCTPPPLRWKFLLRINLFAFKIFYLTVSDVILRGAPPPKKNLGSAPDGRILTEVMSKDWTPWGLCTQPRSRFCHADWLSVVNKMFIKGIWHMTNKKKIILYNWFVPLLANDNKLNLLFYQCLLILLFSSSFLALLWN